MGCPLESQEGVSSVLCKLDVASKQMSNLQMPSLFEGVEERVAAKGMVAERRARENWVRVVKRKRRTAIGK
jgi:hypothetical protein